MSTKLEYFIRLSMKNVSKIGTQTYDNFIENKVLMVICLQTINLFEVCEFVL